MKKIWVFNTAAFLAAFLLFQIQPMASKSLLPFFGGSYLVWGSCMVFFQGMLLIGYLYAHTVLWKINIFTYSRLHWMLLLLPLVFFPFDFNRFTDSVLNHPLALCVSWILFSTLGVPVLVISTASPILQRWLSVSSLPEKNNPYALYASSNLGSMLALLTYPVLFEPYLSLKLQGIIWWSAYIVLVLLHIACMPESGGGVKKETIESPASIRGGILAQWLILAAAGCILLIAVTNVITLDIASVPFLWVLPLSVYLLCFVLTFKRSPWYPPWMERILPWSMIFGMLMYLMTQLHLELPAWFAIIIHMVILFAVCLGCAARLVKLKPDNAAHLTAYYLFIAAGGFIGSLLVSWVIPLISTSLIEYPLGFVIAGAALAYGVKRSGSPAEKPIFVPNGRMLPDALRKGRATVLLIVPVVLVLTFIPWCLSHFSGIITEYGGVVFIIIAIPLALILRLGAGMPVRFSLLLLSAAIAMSFTEDIIAGVGRVRNFRNYYGIYKVFDAGNERYIKHGTTQHGRQYLSGPKINTPLSYYHPTTPAAEILESNEFRFHRIGMVGLGTGALATYMGKNQELLIYELDPDNQRIAEENFTYLEIAEKKGAHLKYIFGDGRVSIGREKPGSLDLIIIDAFNSGSIPVHLMTVEAFEIYLRAVGREGLVLLHVSNKALNLIPVVYSNAKALNVSACEKSNTGNVNPDADETYWMALTGNQETYRILTLKMGWQVTNPHQKHLPEPWTDQTCNIIDAMERRP